MDKFNSLFELFAAFNFAFVLSSDLNSTLHRKLVGFFDAIDKKRKEIETILDKQRDYIKSSKEQGAENPKGLADAILDFEDKITLYESKKDDHSSKTKDINKYFNFYCLYAGLYCVFALLVSALINYFFSEIDTSNQSIAIDAMAVSTLFFIVGLIVLLSKFKWKFEANYISTAWVFIVGLLISILFYWLLLSSKIGKLDIYPLTVITLSLLLPVAHFIFYFFKAYNDNNNIGKIINDDLTTILSECRIAEAKLKTAIEMTPKTQSVTKTRRNGTK